MLHIHLDKSIMTCTHYYNIIQSNFGALKNLELQETVYIGQWCFGPLQSRHLRTSHCSYDHHQLPHYIFLNFTNSLKSSLSKVILVIRIARSHRAPHRIWAVERLSHLYDLMFCQEVLFKMWGVNRHIVSDEADDHQVLSTATFWITQRVWHMHIPGHPPWLPDTLIAHQLFSLY